MKRTNMFFLALLVFILFAPCMAGKAETGTIAISANENIKEYDPLYLSEEDYEIYSGILKRLNAEYGFHLGFTQEDMSRDSDSYVLLFSPEEFESKMREAILAKRAQNPNAVYLFDTTAVPEDECLFTEADVDKRVAFIDNCYMSSEAIAEYQAINDKINEEYGIFTCFVPEMFMPGNPHRPLASYTLAEYEAELRRDVETIIQNNKETEEYKQQLTDTDIIYYSSDIKRVEINAEISIFSHTMDECCAAEDMPEQMILDTNNHFCLETSEREDCDDLESQNRTAVKTIDGVQIKKDSLGNTLFYLETTIGADNFWKYESVDGLSFGVLNSTSGWLYPQSYSYSISNTKEQVTTTILCGYYSSAGYYVPSYTTLSRSFPVAGDCATNSPNYSIAR